MKSINEYLIMEPHFPNDNGERTDEVVGILLASALCGFAMTNFGNSELGKGIGATFAGIGAGFAKMFGFGKSDEKKKNDETDRKSRDDDKSDKKKEDEKKKKQDDEKKYKEEDSKSSSKSKKSGDKDNNAMNKILALIKKSNDNEKDVTKKKEIASRLKLLTACSFDENGNEIPMDKRLEKMKLALPTGTDFEEFKKSIIKDYEEVKDDPSFQKQLTAAAQSIKDSDVDTYVADAQTEARETWSQIAEEKKRQKEIDDEIKNIEKDLDIDPKEKDKKIAELTKEKNTSSKLFKDITDPDGKKSEAAQKAWDSYDTHTKALNARYDKIVKTQFELDEESDGLKKEYETANPDRKKEIDDKLKKIDGQYKELEKSLEENNHAWEELHGKYKDLSIAIESGDDDAINKAQRGFDKTKINSSKHLDSAD